MTEIYLVRHAEAEGNAYRRMHGQYDSLITPNGYRQIEALKQRFAPIHIDACYASDLTRTSITAGAIYRPKGLPLHRDRRFREVSVGRWEDIPFGNLYRDEEALIRQFNKDPVNWKMEGAECFEEYTGRFLQAMEEAAVANEGKTIAIVAHGCVLRGVLLRLVGTDPSHCDNTAVSHLFYDGGKYTCDYFNDNSHLSQEISTLAQQSWWRSKDAGNRDFNIWYQPLTEAGTFVAACRDVEAIIGETRSEAELRQQYFDLVSEGEVLAAMLGEEQVGTVAMKNSSKYPDAAAVWLFHLNAEHRGKRLGPQLLGAAVSYARRQGKKRLLLMVQETNPHALGFYLHVGFEVAETAQGCKLLQMNVDTKRFIW